MGFDYAFTPSARTAVPALWCWEGDCFQVHATTRASHNSSARLLETATAAFVARRYAAHAASGATKKVDDAIAAALAVFRQSSDKLDDEIAILSTPAWLKLNNATEDQVESFRLVYSSFTRDRKHFARVLDEIADQPADLPAGAAILRAQATTTDYGYARLALSHADVDDDAVPRWERELHHKDIKEHQLELKHLCALVGCALKGDWIEAQLPDDGGTVGAAAAAAELWLPLLSGEDAQPALEQLQASPNPFKGGREAYEYGQDIYKRLLETVGRGYRVLTPVTEGSDDYGDLPVLSYEMPTNLSHWGVGSGATLLTEAVAIAVAALSPVGDQLPETGSDPVVTYTRDCEVVVDHLADTFVGWHHARVVDGGQTAHAIAVGRHLAELKRHETKHGCIVSDHPYYAQYRQLDDGIVVPALVYVRGPSAFCRATLCRVHTVLRPTARLFAAVSALNARYGYYKDTQYNARVPAAPPSTFDDFCAIDPNKTVHAIQLLARRAKVLMEAGHRYRQTSEILALDEAIDAAVAALADHAADPDAKRARWV